MNNMYKVFGCYTDLQLNNIFNKLDLTVTEMINMDDIVENKLLSVDEKRTKLLEMFSYSPCVENYSACEEIFNIAKEKEEKKKQLKENERKLRQLAKKSRPLKEDALPNNNETTQLNMNQTIELNSLFELASEKFKKVNCSQQFYNLLSQKTSKNIANAFFNMLKSIPEDSECRFDPQLVIDGKNFSETISPFVNELKTFLNGCKAEKKEEVNEDYDADKLWKIDRQIAQLENNLKKFEEEGKDSYLDEYSKLQYKLDRARLGKLKAKREEYLNESIETQPDMFGGSDTYYKDGIEALDFDNVLDAMNKIAPEMDFVDDRDVKGKYSMIFQPKSSGLELNQKGLKKIKDYLSQRFGKENISVKLAHSQYAPEIKKLYVSFINQIDVQNELNESLEDTLNNFKYFITSSNNEKELNYIKDKLEILFNQANDVNLQNDISEILSMIKSKLNKTKPIVDECCGIDSLLEPFKPTVINITINDDGCLEDNEKELCANSMKALASHINDEKDCCEENNIENMQTINSLLGTIANYFHTKLCENKINPNLDEFPNINILNESIDEYRKYAGIYDLNSDTISFLPKGTIHYNFINEMDVFKGKVRFGVTEYKNSVVGYICSDTREHVMKVLKKLKKKFSSLPIDYWMIEYFEDGKRIKMNIDNYGRSIYENKNDWFPSWENIKNKNLKESFDGIYDEELNEDTVFDHSWYEVKGQKYPRRTKNGVEISEMCSGGACCTGAVATVPSPAKPKTPKRKHKKSKVDEMALNMFKRQIIEDVNSQFNANGNHYEFKNGYLYINGNIARTKSKYKMFEALDEMLELETLPGFNSSEMLMLEDIEANGSVGNEDDNNQDNNNNNNNNANNNNNQQNINKDNLGDVNQNVTQDNDLTPEQRQLKKDTEKVLDQSMNSGSDTEVSVNQGFDNNNDQTTSTQSNTNNVKYKIIGKDDSDSNNIKYIIQDPNSKKTMVVDATKLRLEK